MDRKDKSKENLQPKKSLLLTQSPTSMSWPSSNSGSPILMPVAAISDETVYQNSSNYDQQQQSDESSTILNSDCSSSTSCSQQSVDYSHPSHLYYSQTLTYTSPRIGTNNDTPATIPGIMHEHVYSGVSQPSQNQQMPPAASYYVSSQGSIPTVMTPLETEVTNSNLSQSAPSSSRTYLYVPVQPYWFYKEIVESRELWNGFCPSDSAAIEEAYQQSITDPSSENVVFTNGRRYDVFVKKRERKPVYWEEDVNSVRRCTWFYKTEGMPRYLPYDEVTSSSIEDAYRNCVENDRWLQRLMLADNGGMIYLEDSCTVFHYPADYDMYSHMSDSKSTQRLLHRGLPDDSNIAMEEISRIDHVIMIVQGIGSVCDMRFRTVAQCVDGFREIANRLTNVHFKDHVDTQSIGRVEFLPLAWHSSLHTDNIGFDKRMKSITLQSIPKLRHFINDTLLDILLYSSPMYCQTIMNTVAGGLNNLYNLFMTRNPDFKGGISVAGHSLGSLILFDILANTKTSQNEPVQTGETDDQISVLSDQVVNMFKNLPKTSTNIYSDNEESTKSAFKVLGLEEYLNMFIAAGFNPDDEITSLGHLQESDLENMGFPKEYRQRLLDYVKNTPRRYELRNLPPSSDLGNISDYIMSGGLSSLTTPSSLCPLTPAKTVLSLAAVPSLQFNCECFFALGSPISMFLAVRGFSTISQDFHFPTCPSFYNIFHPFDPVAYRIELLIDPNFTAPPVVIPHHKGRKRMHIEIRENLAKMGTELKQRVLDTVKYTWDHINVLSPKAMPAIKSEVPSSEKGHEIDESSVSSNDCDIKIGALNQGRRIDYVLQEKPIEALNEYIFALGSHGTYWDSEDTVLMILKEMHALHGIYISADRDENPNSHWPLFAGRSGSYPSVIPHVHSERAISTSFSVSPSQRGPLNYFPASRTGTTVSVRSDPVIHSTYNFSTEAQEVEVPKVFVEPDASTTDSGIYTFVSHQDIPPNMESNDYFQSFQGETNVFSSFASDSSNTIASNVYENVPIVQSDMEFQQVIQTSSEPVVHLSQTSYTSDLKTSNIGDVDSRVPSENLNFGGANYIPSIQLYHSQSQSPVSSSNAPNFNDSIASSDKNPSSAGSSESIKNLPSSSAPPLSGFIRKSPFK